MTKGRVGENYNIGGNCEKTNLEVVKTICQLLEELAPNKPNHIKYYEDLMTFVKDRPGHDVRYSLDCSKIHAEVGWQPQITNHEFAAHHHKLAKAFPSQHLKSLKG